MELFIASFLSLYWEMLSLNFYLRSFASIFLWGFPIFLAGVIFAAFFKKTDNVRAAFGLNLLGCMVGGCGEYISLITGLKGLIYLIVFLYILSFLFNKLKL